MLGAFPLMALVLIVYNAVVFGLGLQGAGWQEPVYQLQMASGVAWELKMGDVMIAMGLVLLFMEILKSTRIGRASIVDHMLSTVVLIAFLIQFLLVPEAGNSIFFLLMVMAAIDVLAGLSVSIAWSAILP